MRGGYRTFKKEAETDYLINKSRFIGYALPVEDEAEALDRISQIRRLHKDATHHCYAYILDRNTARFNDDGEPSGTAGMPILEVLKNNDLKNCLIVVVRYFGGILLGAGGLVRAYSHTAALALKSAGAVRMEPAFKLEFAVDYHLYDKIRYWIDHDKEITCVDTDFQELVKVGLVYREAYDSEVKNTLDAMTEGKTNIVKSERLLFPFDEV